MQKKLLLIFFCIFNITAQAEQIISTNKTTGATTWETNHQGVHFSLTQLLPGQLKAFYSNRGFTQEQIQPFVNSCVFMAILRNDSASGDVHFISRQWKVAYNNNIHPLKTINQWLQEFKQENIKNASTIAFRWAQFPPEQTYQPGGDWNQGMFSIGLPPGATFDITAIWDINGKQYQTPLSQVQCAK